MNVLCAAPQPVRPSPVPLAAGGHRRLNSWRLHAASLFAPDAQGPFSLWPRPGADSKAAPKAAPAKAGKKAEAQPDSSFDLEPEMRVGKQRFRSALEQVSYYTSDVAKSYGPQ